MRNINSNKFPKVFKVAKVIPIYKREINLTKTTIGQSQFYQEFQ